MIKCECGKEFETENQLRGHKLHCKPQKTDYKAYKKLPKPIVEHLENTWGNWLNYFEVGQTEWKKDYGGYAIYIKVPERFSTGWYREKRVEYDNVTRAPKVDEEGNQVSKIIVHEDVRVKPLTVPVDEVKTWIDQVKKHIIDKAHQKGLKLPNTQTEYYEELNREEYEKALHK